VTLISALSLGLVACESSSSSPAGGAPALNVIIGSPTLTFGAIYIALEEGLFAKNHVNVKVVSNAAVATQGAMLVGGQTDLSVTASSSGLALRLRGQPFKIVTTITYYDQRSFAVVADKNIRSIQELVAKGSNCSIGVAAPGTAGYGYFAAIQKAFGIDCKVSIFSTTPAVEAGITSGAVQAVVTAPLVGAVLAQRGYNEILNPSAMSESVARKVAPYSYPFAIVGGLASDLEAKKVAVERFIEALRQALALMQGLSAAQLGSITARDTAAFAGTPDAQLTSTYKLVKLQIPTGANAGFVARADWNNELNGLIATRQADVTLSNPVLSYESSVDMSYFNATKAVPKCAAGQRPTTGNICRLS
jgi:NitT/TauT family transport system substrate-binding protein